MVVSGSFYLTSNQATLLNYAIQSANFSGFTSSHLQWKCNCQPFKLHAEYMISGNHNFRLLATQKLIRLPKVIVFALPNDNKGSERGESSNITGDPVVFDPEDASIISQAPGDEVITTLLHSDMNVIHDAEEQGNQENLLDKLKAVRLHVLAMEQWNASRVKTCHRNYLVSAINLIHYLALKSLDTEQLQRELSSFGLLNLETINPHVLASLSAGIHMLGTLENHFLNIPKGAGERISISKGLSKQMKGEFTMSTMMQKVSSNSNRLFGTFQGNRTKHIMVTVGEEAAKSQTFIMDLINAGATIFRINCAHGNPGIWSEIIRKIKKSSHVLEKPCRILMDLAGPKLRTGKLKDGPSVVKLLPKKNALGNVIHPMQVWLAPRGTGPPPIHVSADAVLYVDGQDFLSKLEVNNVVRFSDAHGKQRNMKITTKVPVFSGVGFVGECTKTAYVESGTELYIKDKRRKSSVGFVVDVPPVEQFVKLKVGDLLIISRDGPNEKAVPISSSVSTHRITCSSGYLFDSVKLGEPIAFDDGKIWGIIKGTSISEIVVSITHAAPKGTKLGSEKSINIPQSDIKYEGLTSKDIVDLDFVASHADMVGISFVRDVKDIVVLRQELAKRKIQHLGVVLKIETKGGVEKLPLMILEAMKSPNPLGIMIARGDLAVECGWENLADIQEEIISICRAAHVPVIWATQVLESLVKSGVPTRAEITDVAVGKRASCVMLNKGKHIVEAVSTLDTILNSHSAKVKAGQRTPLSPTLIY